MKRLLCLLLTTTVQIESASTQDLRSIFHIPSKKNYDDLEIAERSNFGDDSTPPLLENPASFANAQVMLRFGGEHEKRKCACEEACQCRPHPYWWWAPPQQYYAPPLAKPCERLPAPCGGAQPLATPYPLLPPFPLPCSGAQSFPAPYGIVPPYGIIPPYGIAPPLSYSFSGVPQYYNPPSPPPIPAPPTKPEIETSQQNKVNIEQNDNVVNEGGKIVNTVIQQNVEIKNDNHPEILKPVQLPEEVVKPVPAPKKIECFEEITNKLQPTELTPNLKYLTLDLSKVPRHNNVGKLEDCLIPYTSPTQTQPKLLVTYPIFKRPQNEVVVKIPCPQSEGAENYSNPLRTIIYKKPVPQERIVTEGVKFILVPVNHPGPVAPTEGCCGGCAQYIGELDEQVL